MLDGCLDPHTVAVAPAPGAKLRLERAGSDEQRPPGRLDSIEDLGQEQAPLLRHEPAEVADDGCALGPPVSMKHRGAGTRIRCEARDVDTRRDHADRCADWRPRADDIEHRPAERDDPARPSHGVALDPAERGRVMLRDVLERREHERDGARRRERHLCGGGDIRLFPAVDEIPGLTQQLRELASVQHEVDRATEVDRDRNDGARLVRSRLERVPPEIAAEPGRPDRRDVPVTVPGELLRQPPVQLDAVRMRDGQEPPSGHEGTKIKKITKDTKDTKDTENITHRAQGGAP